MPVQPSYETEAAQPHLPAQARGNPSSCTPCTLCAPDNSLDLVSSPCVFLCVPGAWHLYPSLMVGNLCILHILSSEHHSTLRQSCHQQETPVVLSQKTFVVTQLWDSPVTGGNPLWQPYHNNKPRVNILYHRNMTPHCKTFTWWLSKEIYCDACMNHTWSHSHINWQTFYNNYYYGGLFLP